MYAWEKMFQETALEKGKTAYKGNRVRELTKDGDTYSAAVLDRERHEVTITMQDGRPKRGKCDCPVAKSRELCGHMAALLYVIEDEKKRQEKKVAREEEEKERRRLARERRQKERKQKEIEKQQKAEAARRLAEEEAEKKAAQERERDQKEAEQAARRAARKRLEEEARRIADERQREEEARQRAAERQRKAEKRRAEEERARIEEQRKKEEEEEKRRKAEEEKRKEEEEKKRREEEQRRWEESREKDYSLLGDAWEEEEDTEQSSYSIQSLEHYQYFDIRKIRRSIKFPGTALKEGKKLYEQGAVEIMDIHTGYSRDNGEMCGEIHAVTRGNGQEIVQMMQFSRTKALRMRCGCPQCARMFYSFSNTWKSTCRYSAAMVDALEEYLSVHKLGDATDLTGCQILDALGGKSVPAEGEKTENGRLMIEAKLSESWYGLEVSFRIGDGKMFVIKNLDEFYDNVKNSRDALYGKSTTFNHALSNFTEEGKRWVGFISKVMREDEQLSRQGESRYYTGWSPTEGKTMNLYGWRLDSFYKTAEANGSVEYESMEGGRKKQETLAIRTKNPEITVDIAEENIQDSAEFHGIAVDVALPELYSGVNADYYIEDGYLNRADAEFSEKLGAFREQENHGHIRFHVGRSRLNDFYYRALPQLEEIAKIHEHSPEKIRQYLTPEAKFIFYLDADKSDVFCRIAALYAKKEFSVVGSLIRQKVEEQYRDVRREMEILDKVLAWMPSVDREEEALCTGGDEDRIYAVMTEGVDTFLQLGEVRCTDSFRNHRVIRKVKARVGVSVSGGLLELEISADGLDQKELMDILHSYRVKKKYHRLTDGSYVGLEDESVGTLEELMEALNLKPAEMIKGKVHIPLYRSLYLDRMLAENDEIYSRRDSHFREMVKEFKTIDDSEFEEPESLSEIMRNYQKEGFKWMRTLEEWNLGGILADDMGLGKTLQAIALLLSAKLEGRGGCPDESGQSGKSGQSGTCALIVAPAALVYNWEEEFHRFAPEMSVAVIAGNQEERREKIGQYRDYDVLVTSYDTLRRDVSFYEDKEFRYQIIDEAQYIKNHTTAAAKAVKIIKSRIRYALTGTPIENRLSELWSIFDYLMPGFLYSYEVFRREIETPIVKYQDEEVMARLQKMTGPFILRRLKENVLKDLPEKLEEIRYVRFDGEQRNLYDAQVLHMRETLAAQAEEDFNKNRFQVLAELTRLRQICCAPSLCFENYRGEAAKVDACAQLIQSAMDGGHRMLVFSQFTSMLEILEKELDKEDIEYYVITGSTPKEERLRLVKEFNEGNVPVFFISLKAGGVGLNLTGADVVIHYDPWWNQAVQNQATDRAHRIGQTKKVTVYKLIAKNTIEEKIQKLQETKQDLADQIIGGKTGQLAGMSREDILALLEA